MTDTLYRTMIIRHRTDRSLTPLLKIYEYLNFMGINSKESCWEWPVTDKRGYGVISRHAYGMNLAHRYMYQIMVEDLDADLVINHLCRNHSCVNPFHLEQVTQKVNILAGVATSAVNSLKQYCVNGHSLSGKNLLVYIRKNGTVNRICKYCANKRTRETRRKLADLYNPTRSQRPYRLINGDYDEYYS